MVKPMNRLALRSASRQTPFAGEAVVSRMRTADSFAVSIADGPITRIDRIWANGEVLETAGLNYRVYTGSETQQPDPVISAVEGDGEAPAYRGTAYVVFEDFPLEAFGNRLPQLSFEVVRAGARAELIGAEKWRLSRLLRGLAGSQSVGAAVGAKCLKVGPGLVSATFDASEIGMQLHWRAGRAETQTQILQDEAAKPWRVGHLRATRQAGGVKASWTGRGPDRPTSWAVPEAENTGLFQVALEFSNGAVETQTIDQTELALNPAVNCIRVAEMGDDGRLGPWASIPISDH